MKTETAGEKRQEEMEDLDLPPWTMEEERVETSLLASVERDPSTHLNTVVLAVLFAIVLALLGFVQVSLPNPVNWYDPLLMPTDKMGYGFQLPVALFAGALLGPVGGGLAVALFILCGLFVLPVFAGGGGLDYALNPGFGFLLGMFFAAALCGENIGKVLRQGRNNLRPAARSIRLVGIGVAGVIVVHMAGITYMLGLSLFQMQPLEAANHWVLYLSLAPLFYDLISAMIFMIFVRYARLFLWPALY